MNQDIKVKSPSIRLSTVATSTRQTPKTDFGTVMRAGLIKVADVAQKGLQVAAPFIPGGAIVSAAVANASSLVSSGGGAGPSYSSGGGGASGFSSSTSGLSGGSGPVSGGGGTPGQFGQGGNMFVPGRRPGLGTNMNQSSTNFAPGGAGGATGGSDAFSSMMSATKQMAEFQASFNLQYLQLQEKIQQDTRQFNLISNIMKTKHDAAKNALNNVR